MGVHNGEQYLSEAIESILVQSILNFEFIIVDDGSTDNTAKVLLNFAKKDNPKVKKIYLKQVKNVSFPKNSSININKLKKILKK